jgi:Domain of unknown function (DUF4340)
LLAATMLAVAASGYALMQDNRAVHPAFRARPAFPDLAAQLGDLAWLRLAHGADAIDFASIGGAWTVVERANYPAAPARVRRLLRGLAELVLVAPKTRRPALFGRLGLDDPRHGRSTLVTAQDRAGKSVVALIVGKACRDPLCGGVAGVYVRRPGNDQTWLARGALHLAGDATGWLDRRILDIAPSEIASITLTSADGAVLHLRRDTPAAAFAVAGLPAGAKVANTAALALPSRALVELQLDEVKPAAELPLPQRGVATATFATFAGITIELRLFAEAGRDWIRVSASGKGAAAGDAAALDARLARWVYAVPADRARSLRLADVLAQVKGM